MEEVKAIRDAVNPAETLLVVDAMTGQDAVNTATRLQRGGAASPASCMTRLDGDARGGAALSMRAVTGAPIKLAGIGREARRAGGIPPRAHRRPHPRHGRHCRPGRDGRRDISTRRRPKNSPRRWRRASSTWTTTPAQLKQITKMGSLSGIIGMLPGVGKIKQQLEDANLDTDHVQAPGGHHRLDDHSRSAAPRISSRPAARSASPRAPAPPCRK